QIAEGDVRRAVVIPVFADVPGPEAGEFVAVAGCHGASKERLIVNAKTDGWRNASRVPIPAGWLQVADQIGLEVRWTIATTLVAEDDLYGYGVIAILPVHRSCDAKDAGEIAGVVHRPSVR